MKTHCGECARLLDELERFYVNLKLSGIGNPVLFIRNCIPFIYRTWLFPHLDVRTFTDVDALREINGHFLVMEFKYAHAMEHFLTASPQSGQRRALRSLLYAKSFTLLNIGTADDALPVSWQVETRAQPKGELKSTTEDEVVDYIKRWTKNAKHDDLP